MVITTTETNNTNFSEASDVVLQEHQQEQEDDTANYVDCQGELNTSGKKEAVKEGGPANEDEQSCSKKEDNEEDNESEDEVTEENSSNEENERVMREMREMRRTRKPLNFLVKSQKMIIRRRCQLYLTPAIPSVINVQRMGACCCGLWGRCL
jgi:hypothetical protein